MRTLLAAGKSCSCSRKDLSRSWPMSAYMPHTLLPAVLTRLVAKDAHSIAAKPAAPVAMSWSWLLGKVTEPLMLCSLCQKMLMLGVPAGAVAMSSVRTSPQSVKGT